MKSEQKTAIVTGGAQGIGQQVALKLAGEGIAVFIADMAEDLARQTVQMIEDTADNEAFAVKTDVVEAALFLLSDRAGYITGQTLNINGGLYMD